MNTIKKLSWKLMVLIFTVACTGQLLLGPPIEFVIGEITRVKDAYGVFFVYVPTSLEDDSRTLVVVHGTPAIAETAEETAKYYITHWLGFAEENSIVVIAPSFTQRNFSSRKGELENAMTGYRGLFGREIEADDWVLRLVKEVQQQIDTPDQKLLLYGHSAGGQFVSRFLVTHPAKIQQVVISAAATYPHPNSDIAWPFGMAVIQTVIKWDDQTTTEVSVFPEKQKWLDATQIKLTVIVGMNDTERQPDRPGQQGTHRIALGKNWIEEMKSFAEENGLHCDYVFELIPGKGHSMSGLVEFAQIALQSR